MATHLDQASVDDVIRRALPVADSLASRGHRSFVVGGLVRDLHLGGGSSTDVDITTDATPEVMKEAFADIADDLWAQGERFGTIGMRIGATEFEVTTHRSESYDEDSRKPKVEFSTAIEADLSRRDFTVNAMALEVPSGRLVDPFDGAADLAAGTLRTPGAPSASFTDDPLRMLRAARFFAGYQLEPAADLESAMTEFGERIAIVSQERVRDELAKLLVLDRPGEGIRLLGRTGLLARIVDGYDEPTGEDVAGLVDSVSNGELVRRAAFHLVLAERAGEAALGSHLSKRRYSAKEQRDTLRVVSAARGAADNPAAVTSDVGVRTFLSASGEWVAEATELLAFERLAGAAVASQMAARVTELAATEDVTVFDPALTGAEVMEILGLESGPEVGAALAFLRDLRMAEGELSPEQASRRLVEWRSQSEG